MKTHIDPISDCPAFLKPKARLFLSVDLVGSTAHKQAARFPIREPKHFFEGGLSPQWLSPIADFFTSFHEVFISCWEEKKASLSNKGFDQIPIGLDPEIWKANGDELIFTKELKDKRELYLVVLSWIDAIQKYRSEIRPKKRLDLKSCIWFAGFPVSNVEIVLEKNGGKHKDIFDEDSRLKQLYLLEKYYESEGKAGLVMDFLGPSIDTGFRLATHATPRKLVVSIEVAYLFAAAKMPTGVKYQGILDWPKIYYDGRREFKGVLGGRPYPIFWLDLHANNETALAEDQLCQKIPALEGNLIEKFCEQFFSDNMSLILTPFIYGEHQDQYGNLPENYVSCILHMAERWKKEKRRYEGEIAPIVPSEEGLFSPDIDDLVKKLESALPSLK